MLFGQLAEQIARWLAHATDVKHEIVNIQIDFVWVALPQD